MSLVDRLGQPLPRRIAVVRALNGLGDLLCIVPALRALRSALPEAEIALVGLPGARPFVDRFNHYLDALLEYPGFPGIPERPPIIAELPAFFAGAVARRFDLALQMHGNGVASNAFTVMLGARLTAGFYLPGYFNPDPERFLPYPDDLPEVRRHLRLMEFLGVPPQGEALEFPLRPADRDALGAVAGTASLEPGAYVCVHPGASEPARRWPLANFAAVADALARSGYRVVLTGTLAEASITAAVAQRMSAPAIDLAGRTDLGAMASLLSRARLLISNDTGISHLAAALRVPSVVVFLASDPVRWAPLDRHLHRIVGLARAPVLAGDDGAEPAQAAKRLNPGHAIQRPALDATPEAVLAQAEMLLAEDAHAA